MTGQVPLSDPDTERAQFPSLAAMKAASTGSVLRRHNGTGDTAQGSREAMTESPESEKPEASRSPTARPSPAPPLPEHAAEDMRTEPDNNASEVPHSPRTLAA